jgi:hypothetical protein
VERASPLSFTDEQVIERVDIRLARQSVLHRESEPLDLVAVLHEGALTDALGGRDVMAEQLDHLAAMADRPNIDLRILPADGRGTCCTGEFELLSKPGEVAPFMAVTADPGGPDYHERDVDAFAAMFTHIHAVALTPAESVALITRTREDRYR